MVLMVGHTFEYHAAVWKLRDMVASGELGDLYYLDTARLNLGLYQHDVNVVFDLAPHDISILNYVLGSSPTQRRVLGRRGTPTAGSRTSPTCGSDYETRRRRPTSTSAGWTPARCGG